MLIVRVLYKDGTTDLKECFTIDELSLVNVESMRVIRDERASK